MEMTELIKRLEAATGPSRELDADIARATGLQVKKGQLGGWVYIAEGRTGWELLPYFTESVDAALTLVPEGWSSSLNIYPVQVKPTPIWKAASHVNPNDGSGRSGYLGDSATPPIALCIAALKARQDVGDKG